MCFTWRDGPLQCASAPVDFAAAPVPEDLQVLAEPAPAPAPPVTPELEASAGAPVQDASNAVRLQCASMSVEACQADDATRRQLIAATRARHAALVAEMAPARQRIAVHRARHAAMLEEKRLRRAK